MPLVLPCLALQCTCFNFRLQGIMWKFATNFCQVPSGTRFEEENTAYLLVSWLLWVLPMTVTCRSSFGRHHHWTPEAALAAVTFGPHQQLMDAILVYGYLKWAHPWAGILGTTEFVVPFSSLSSSLKSKSTFLRDKTSLLEWKHYHISL